MSPLRGEGARAASSALTIPIAAKHSPPEPIVDMALIRLIEPPPDNAPPLANRRPEERRARLDLSADQSAESQEIVRAGYPQNVGPIFARVAEHSAPAQLAECRGHLQLIGVSSDPRWRCPHRAQGTKSRPTTPTRLTKRGCVPPADACFSLGARWTLDACFATPAQWASLRATRAGCAESPAKGRGARSSDTGRWLQLIPAVARRRTCGEQARDHHRPLRPAWNGARDLRGGRLCDPLYMSRPQRDRLESRAAGRAP